MICPYLTVGILTVHTRKRSFDEAGTHIRLQRAANDGTGAPSRTDMGESSGIATGGVLTLFLAVPPNGSSVGVRVVNEVSGAVFEQEVAAVLPADTHFLSPRLSLNYGAAASAVAYERGST